MSLEAVLIVIAAVLTVLYAGGVALLNRGLRAALRRRGSSLDTPFLSVVIAARNEESHIKTCIQSVLGCDYPEFEIVVVDDSSTDRTAQIAEALATNGEVTQNVSVKVFRLDSNRVPAGKMVAIAHGIEVSRGEILLTLDADCLVKPGWLRSMVEYMGEDTGYVAGPVVYRTRNGVFRRTEALEFAFLAGVGAGAIGLGRPLICNSANAAYRRSVYESMNGALHGVRHTAADELLMNFVHDETDYDVEFCASPEAAVQTDGASSLRHFLSQRMRWVTIVNHLPLAIRTLLAIVFLYFALIAAVLLGGLWEPFLTIAGLLALVAKALADYRLLSTICRHLGSTSLLRALPALEVLYVPYVLITTPAGLATSTSWKGRRTSRVEPPRAAATP